MGRAGQPVEVATCCVFLASEDSSYISGNMVCRFLELFDIYSNVFFVQLHPNGGTVIN